MSSSVISSICPWITTPLVVNGPMASVAGAKLATQVSLCHGIGFIGGGIDMKKANEALSLAHNLLSSHDAQNHPLTKTLPVGLGVLCFGSKIPDVIAVVKTHKPFAVWLFASQDDPAGYFSWAQALRGIESEEEGYRPQIWIQTSSIRSIIYLVQEVEPDVLVLQGSDAGSHGASPGASLISLLPEAREALATAGLEAPPLIAAGGIADGNGAAAALVLGADGVCIGTRFIASEEAEPVYEVYKDIILATNDGGYSTIRSTVFDDMNASGNIWPKGYDGRGLRNATTREHDGGEGIEVLKGRFADAAKADQGGWTTDIGDGRVNVWAGTAVGLVKELQSVKSIVENVREGAKEALRKATSRL